MSLYPVFSLRQETDSEAAEAQTATTHHFLQCETSLETEQGIMAMCLTVTVDLHRMKGVKSPILLKVIVKAMNSNGL
jgi:hypothetical protein